LAARDRTEGIPAGMAMEGKGHEKAWHY